MITLGERIRELREQQDLFRSRIGEATEGVSTVLVGR